MVRITHSTFSRISWLAAGALLCSPSPAASRLQQDPPDHTKHAEHTAKNEATPSENLAAQLAELQAKVAKLEAALHQNHQGSSTASTDAGQAASGDGMNMGADPAMKGMGMKKMGGMGMMKKGGMGMMKGMGGMGGMKSGSDSSMQAEGMGDMDMSSSSSMSTMEGASGSDSGMSMGMGSMGGMRMDQMKRMSMMGKMGRGSEPPRAAVMSALPGFPGASHIYHIGASDHFLDYADALMLTQDQLKQLAQVHQESQLQQNDFERRLEQAEQELWVLTSAGEPDAEGVAAKVREVGMTQADMRLAFIRSVGKAAKLLTAEQRLRLVGEYRVDAAASTSK